MWESGILKISEDSDIGQHVSPTSKPGLKESRLGTTFVLWDKNMGSNMHTRKHNWYALPKKPFIPVLDRTHQFQLLRILLFLSSTWNPLRGLDLD